MSKIIKPTYKIFSFSDITTEEVYANHMSRISIQETSENNSLCLNSVIEQYNRNNENITNKIPRKKEMLEKYMFMIHFLITKTFYTGYVDLPAAYLRELFGDYYVMMLTTLCDMGYFSRQHIYQPNEYVKRIYIIRKNIICRQRYDYGFEKYHNRYIRKKEKNRDTIQKRLYDYFGENYIDQYNQNLSMLKFNDIHKTRSFVLKNMNESEYIREKNLFILDRYLSGNNEIYSTDDNDRIYSILTITNRNLRPYLNIKYILDISNYHPLLFCKNIIDKYNIEFHIIEQIYNINTNVLFDKNIYIYTQYDSNVYHKLLIDNNIQSHELNGISDDELLYITLTSQGRFWEYIMLNDKFHGVDRSEVKERMFKEVFYSKVLGGTNMVYQEEFKKTFPNVFKLIMNFRRQHRKGEKHLSHYLMKMESDIIHQVLRKLFKMGIVAVNIHDAIVVLDVEKNNQTKLSEIVGIIDAELRNQGLYGNVKIDSFKTTTTAPVQA